MLDVRNVRMPVDFNHENVESLRIILLTEERSQVELNEEFNLEESDQDSDISEDLDEFSGIC